MSADRAQQILEEAYGPEAAFKDGQLEAIVESCRPGGRTLIVQKTGWGKSIVYFIATRIRREAGYGPTVLVSPLLSLMRNQIESAAKLGVRAISINSTNRDDWDDLTDQLKRKEVDLLLISPERLGNPTFRDLLLTALIKQTGLFVIDEAHCISDWGHDFRPDYRRILDIVHQLPPETPILGTTATANDRVIEDIKEQLGEQILVQRGPLMRESLRVHALRLDDQTQRLAWLAKYLPKLKGTGIVYTLTVADANRVAEWLQKNGIDAVAYHATLETETRVAIEDRLQNNQLKAVVATTALGMGYDKPDVAFVVHFQRPGSIIAYYQQIGRAGRSIPSAEVVLLTGREDDDIVQHFIDGAFPSHECFDAILALLGERPIKGPAIMAQVNFRPTQVAKVLKLLEVEGAIRQEKDGYVLLDLTWQRNRLKSEEITRHRYTELEQMNKFVDDEGCRMLFLARALDDAFATECGKCDNCLHRPLPQPGPAEIADAQRFLRSSRMSIEPKKMWPPGFVAEGAKKIPEELRNEPGTALSTYGDAGWGRIVSQCKYKGGPYTDELVEASAQLVKGSGAEWLTWVPCMGGGDAVEEFAQRLAKKLGIPAVAAVTKTHATTSQKTMQNSTHQLNNVFKSFKIGETNPSPCLLVDDIVDSGWTLTAVGSKLRKAGVPKVIPFALASSRPRDDTT